MSVKAKEQNILNQINTALAQRAQIDENLVALRAALQGFQLAVQAAEAEAAEAAAAEKPEDTDG